jgi:excisionase family DNA binding protein
MTQGVHSHARPCQQRRNARAAVHRCRGRRGAAHDYDTAVNRSREGRVTVNMRLLTVDEAADQLRVSRWTVYNLIRSNQLRTVKIGRRRLVTPAALAECVESLAEVA